MQRLTAAAAIWLRASRGGVAAKRGEAAPEPTLFLYDFEGSPMCRRVREHVCQLDLKVRMRPCPREVFFAQVGPPLQEEGWCSDRSRFRQEVRALGGKVVFPFLVDSTRKLAMNGSDDIVRYLWKHYGTSVTDPAERPINSYNVMSVDSFAPEDEGVCVAPPSHPMWKILDQPTLVLSCLVRPWPRCGVMLTPSRISAGCDVQPPHDVTAPADSTVHRAPESAEAVELYAHEACTGSRLVREALSTLQIPYMLIPAGAGSRHTSPTGQTPYLRVGSAFASSDAEMAVRFLFAEFAAGPTRSWFARKD